MIEYETVIKKLTAKKPVRLVCDKCGNKFNIDDYNESQEFHRINFEGGYGSVFGDGVNVKADICQHCLLEMIKDFMRVS